MVLPPKPSPPRRSLRSTATLRPEKLPRLRRALPNKRQSDLSDSDETSPPKRRRTDSPSPRHQRIPLRRREHDNPPPQADIPQPITGSLQKSRRQLPPVNTSIAGGTTLNGERKIPIQTSNGEVSGQNDKRALRSHDGGSRSKSELAMYFNNYEQMISLEPQPTEFLMPSSQITLIDDLPHGPDLSESQDGPKSPQIPTSQRHSFSRQPIDSTIYTGWKHLHNVRRISLVESDPGSRRSINDPLPSDIFMTAHKRPERQEKQLRNIEKERAQHEKVQLDRLLAELKGPDWLRAMGISGITETEKKLYEPKRAMFTREVSGMIEKFKHWKEEEKRRKIERDQALLAEEEEDDISNAESEASDNPPSQSDEQEDEDEDEQEDRDPPDSNELDAWAARQLHQEAKSASSTTRRKRLTKSTAPPPITTTTSNTTAIQPLPLPPPPPPLSPIKSFYAKKHIRDAAVGNHRRGGRMITAFGHPLPDMVERERDFELPDELLSEDNIRAIARRRRRLKRDRPGE